jgi:hypothetical protein
VNQNQFATAIGSVVLTLIDAGLGGLDNTPKRGPYRRVVN